jgi:hypothetical protein
LAMKFVSFHFLDQYWFSSEVISRSRRYGTSLTAGTRYQRNCGTALVGHK